MTQSAIEAAMGLGMAKGAERAFNAQYSAYNAQKSAAMQKIADAEQELALNEQKLIDGRKQLDDGKIKITKRLCAAKRRGSGVQPKRGGRGKSVCGG